MHALIILEITRQPDGSLPDRLLSLAYRASQRGCVMLALNGVSPFEVDAALDPLVEEMPLDIPGVIYRDVRDENALSEALECASMVFLSRQMVRRYSRLRHAAKKRYAPPTAALSVLERIGRPTSIRELAGRRSAATPPFEQSEARC